MKGKLLSFGKSNKNKKTIVLELQNIQKSYPLGGIPFSILQSTNLVIYEGDYVSIKGPSGSGKSTLLHLMGLLDIPTAGQVFLEGNDVSMLSEEELAKIRNRSIGFIFQQFNLLPRLTTVEQVELPLLYGGVSFSERQKRARLALLHVGLGDRLSHRPNQLSGGQQQRVAIARALVTNPRIMLADEPTGNLDSVSSNTVMDLLDELNAQGRTIVVVTHETSIAVHARRHLTIADGVVTENS